jgi:hypothetical protein
MAPAPPPAPRKEKRLVKTTASMATTPFRVRQVGADAYRQDRPGRVLADQDLRFLRQRA